MRLLEIIRQWFTKSNPTGALTTKPGSSFDGGSQPHEPDYNVAANLAAFKVEPWVYRCLTVIGKNITSSPLIVEQQKTVNGEMAWGVVTSGNLCELIDNPNPEFTLQELITNSAIALCGAGDAYLTFDKIANELWYADPTTAKVVANKTDGTIGFEFKRGSKTVTLERDEVCHIRLPNPFDSWYGLSPIKAAEVSILTNYYDRRFLKNFFKNSGVPSAALESDRPCASDEAVERTRKSWQRIHGGTANAGKVAILWDGLKYKPLSFPLKDLVMDTLRKMTREEIAAVFGVPGMLLGIIEDVNKANGKEVMRAFWETEIIPYQKLFASALTNQIVKPHFSETLRLRFDNSQQDFLQEDQNQKADRVTKIYTSGLTTKNEARERLGLESIDGGDEFYTAGGFGAFNMDDDGGDSKTGMPSWLRAGVKNDGAPRLILWKKHDQFLTTQENKVETAVIRFWDGQLDRILEGLGVTTSKGQFMSRLGVWITKDDVPFDPKDTDAIFNKAVEAQILREHFDAIITNITADAGQRAIDSINISMEFRVDNPEVQNLINQFLNRSERINDTTYRDVKRILSEAYDEGLGIDEAERRLRDLFKSYYKVKPGDPGIISRGKRFARTEMNGVVNGGGMEAYKQAGIEGKEWLTNIDSETREQHIYADGEVVKIGEPFIKTGDPLMYPGDPGGAPENVINCRCSLLPVANIE